MPAAWTDAVISRLTDTLLAVPGIMLAISLALFLGGSLFNATLAIAVAAVPAFIRLARARTIQVTAEPYIEAARSVGVRDLPAPLRPHLPEPRAADHRPGDAGDGGRRDRRGEPVVPRPRPAAAGAVLGLDAHRRQGLHRLGAWLSIWPGLCIFLVTVGFSLLGDGLRQSLDRR